jgi:hypothetical protein
MRARELQPAAPVEPLLEQEHDMSVPADDNAIRNLAELTERLADKVLATLRQDYEELEALGVDLATLRRLAVDITRLEVEWFGAVGVVVASLENAA